MTSIEQDFSAIGLLPQRIDSAIRRDRLRQCADGALFRHALPKCYGGLGDGFVALCRRHEQLGKDTCDPGLVLAVNAHLWGALFPIFRHGSESMKQALLPRLCSGDCIGGHAITEAEAGSDVQAMSAQARAVPDGYRLTGVKRYITNAPIADLMVVYARLPEGIGTFLVERGDSGVQFTATPTVVGCGGAAMGEVILDEAFLGPERLLGKAGAGGMMIQQALELERAFIFAGITGVMDWQLRQVVAHSRSRRSGGVHLGKHQAISHRIADMKLRVDGVRLWVRECARLCDGRARITLASAETKLYAAEAFLQSSLEAVQILGAKGLEENQPMARLVQDALAGRLFSGTSEIQRNIIAALLGTGDGYRGGA